MEIVQLCGVENFLKISLISKQFYFLVKSDNFWLKMLKTTDLKESEIEEQSKSQRFVEIYRDYLMGWDPSSSNLKRLVFDGNLVVHNQKDGLAAAVTKKKFVLGSANYLFVVDMFSIANLTATGVCVENW